MEKKRKISQYRERLDKTLASPDLTNEEMIKVLVKNQLLRSSQNGVEGCSEKVIEKRTLEVSNFLDMLRSASLNENEAPKARDTSHPEWKLKQDTEEFRVMYREGIQGSPFHTLLVEGYVDGPVDECLCVSWESSLYRKWWPQTMVPTFKVTSSKCVQKVRIGEQISLVRMKVPWPLSDREAVVHYFEFEYAQDDLVVVLVNTISDMESIDRDTHGFSKDGIPEVKDGVRIDMVGGFVIQKVTPERSYFRTISNMDIKVDFVPPSLMNFIARQLIGNGFRLYEKIVASAFKNDEDFRKALADPLYVRIRKALSSSDEPNGVFEQDELNSDNSDTFSLPEEHSPGSPMQDGLENVDDNREDHESDSSEKSVLPAAKKVYCEIEEEDSEDIAPLETTSMKKDQALSDTQAKTCYVNGNKKVVISAKVEDALGTLDKTIYLIKEYGFNVQSKITPGLTNVESSNVEQDRVKDKNPSNGEVCTIVYQNEPVEKSSQEPKNSSGRRDLRPSLSKTYSRELSFNRIAPASTEQNLKKPDETHQIALSSSTNGTTEAPIPDKTVPDKMQMTSDANGIEKNGVHGGKQSGRRMKHRLCCFRYNFC